MKNQNKIRLLPGDQVILDKGHASAKTVTLVRAGKLFAYVKGEEGPELTVEVGRLSPIPEEVQP